MMWFAQARQPAWVAGIGAFLVAVAGGLATDIGPWYFALRKPSWQPPDWLFGPVWTTIFVLCAVAAAGAWRSALTRLQRSLTVSLFLINGLLNVGWSVLFFTLHRPDWALLEVVFLWVSVLALILFLGAFYPLTRWLLAPYMIWVSFAALLNCAIVQLNHPFSSATTKLPLYLSIAHWV
jgi:translocator protein